MAVCHIDSDEPAITVAERVSEVGGRHVGQAESKTARKGPIGLHPLVVAALRRHRWELSALGLFASEGFVFCTRNGTPISVSNLRRALDQLCARRSCR